MLTKEELFMAYTHEDVLFSGKKVSLAFAGIAFGLSGLTYFLTALWGGSLHLLAIAAVVANVVVWLIDFMIEYKHKGRKEIPAYKFGRIVLYGYAIVIAAFILWYIVYRSFPDNMPALNATVLLLLLSILSWLSAVWKWSQMSERVYTTAEERARQNG